MSHKHTKQISPTHSTLVVASSQLEIEKSIPDAVNDPIIYVSESSVPRKEAIPSLDRLTECMHRALTFWGGGGPTGRGFFFLFPSSFLF